MASRIFWVLLAGAALVTGMVVQDGGWLFDSVDRELTIDRAIDAQVDRSVDAQVDRVVDAEVDRVVDGNFDQMGVFGPDGREIDVPVNTKRALAEAVGRLVKAQADVAILRVSDASEEEIRAANVLRDQARAEVDRLKAQIKNLEQASRLEQDAVRQEIQREVREDIRATVREAVRN